MGTQRVTNVHPRTQRVVHCCSVRHTCRPCRSSCARVAPREENPRIARAVADALATAHEAGIIHRDLKPTNILLTRETQAVKLADSLGWVTSRGNVGAKLEDARARSRAR